ncbi:dipeptide epimerase [Sphingorhabdus lutea]|uniref:Dipeptide epimerase n=1 Tax=Sphingorhabdus lutea TaxID=1913578 RepID=A0A1L3JAI7_9SPHN|nr:dipeptide epimerase [Sphingorhabdus lutea]APG62142.1 dipeptide epimerase [Sphingorhabdus lutea]
MGLRISAAVENWPVRGAFVISRGAKTSVDVLVAVVGCDGHYGMGEATPIYYRGENTGNCLAQIEAIIPEIAGIFPYEAQLYIAEKMPAGAARNALDCALWDLRTKISGRPLWQILKQKSAPQSMLTAFTISLGSADDMHHDAAAAAANGYGLLKLKLTGEGDVERVAAVHHAAPHARIIVDANESWQGRDIMAQAAKLLPYAVEAIEQPLPAGQDDILLRGTSPIPIIADESCHHGADIARLSAHYDGINIKLDKAGGLSEAMAMMDAAKAHDMKIMVGCMLSTSMGIYPAFHAAQMADWVDLDGPALLAEDREDGFIFENGMIVPPSNVT